MLGGYDDGLLASTSYTRNQTRDTTHVAIHYQGVDEGYTTVGRIKKFIRIEHLSNGQVASLCVAVVDFYRICLIYSDPDICDVLYRCRVTQRDEDTFSHQDYVVDIEAVGSKLAYTRREVVVCINGVRSLGSELIMVPYKFKSGR